VAIKLPEKAVAFDYDQFSKKTEPRPSKKPRKFTCAQQKGYGRISSLYPAGLVKGCGKAIDRTRGGPDSGRVWEIPAGTGRQGARAKMKKNISPLLRLLNICRVSSHEQTEGFSLEMQDQANREWAQRRGYAIVDTIQYVETASKQKERKRFQEIINKICTDHTIDGVVFHKVDRACRNLSDLALLERIENEKNKKVFFSSQEFPQNAAGRLSVGMMGVVSRWYTDNLKEEVNKGFRGKIEAGEYPHRPPYGYIICKTAKMPVPDPEKAQNVRKIFSLMASGNYSLKTLRKELFEKGLYFSSRTHRWTTSHLARTLHHSFYIGKMLWRGQIYPGKHEPIIDELLWNKVQNVLEGRGKKENKNYRQFTYGHGLIKCARCGYNITADMHKKRYTYYFCSQRQHQKHPVKPAWVSEPDIESQIITLLGRLVLPKEIYEWAKEYLQLVLVQDESDMENELMKLKRRLSETQTTMDALLLKAAHAEEDLAEGFMRLARDKHNEATLVKQRIDEITQGKRDYSSEPVRIIELAQNLSTQYVTLKPPQKRQIVNSVLSNLELDDITLCGTYRLPFAILAENANHPLNSG
jgi:site-specific DNA recombinase